MGNPFDSPDKNALKQFAQALSYSASNFSGLKEYDVGSMTEKVYAVDGGMEDWSHALGWENEVISSFYDFNTSF